MVRRTLSTLCLALLLAPAGCLDVGDPAYITGPIAFSDVPSGAIEFDQHILPIFERNFCLDCHPAGGAGFAGLDLSSVEAVAAGGDSGAVVVPCNSSQSLLHTQVETGTMPQDLDPLSDVEVDIIAKWIDQGATATFSIDTCPSPPFP